MRIIYIALILMSVSCSKNVKQEKFHIVTGIQPIASLIQQIGGTHIKATAIIPANVDPHTFSLKVSDGMMVAKADMLIALHEHIDGALLQIADQTNTIVLRQDHEDFLEKKDFDHHAEEKHSHAHAHEHGSDNSHYWLSYTESMKIASEIMAILQKAMPEHKDVFEKNYQEVVAALKADFKTYHDRKYDFVVIQRHSAWDYIFDELHIHQIAVLEEFENQQTSFKKVGELLALIKNQNKQVILIDDAFSTPSTVFTELEKETSAKIVRLNPIQTDKKSSKIVDLLRYNIELLAKE
ncbi:MAG: metal ABC transporter substrate-binding protein [Brevinema sp.]